MGQTSSQTKSTSDGLSDPAQTYGVNGQEINPKLGTPNDNIETQTVFCCVIKTNKKNFTNNKWKKQMISQIENLELGTWPKLLCKSLKRFEMGNDDRVFQADVFWAYKNYATLGNKSFSVQSVLSQSKDEMISFLDSLPSKENNNNAVENDAPGLMLKSARKKSQDEAVQGLLETAPILEEKFYNDCHRETWMQKSFDIKVFHINTAANDSFQRLPLQRISTEKTENNNNNAPPTPEFLTSKKNSEYTKHIEKYRNNTFVNQLAPLQEESDEANALLQSILRYKTVTDIIDKHTKQKRNVFWLMLSRFTAYFLETYTPIIEQAKKEEISTSQFRATSFKATTDLQQFIRIIFEGLCSFYRLDNLDSGNTPGREVLFSRDNLLSFTTSLVFTKEVYEVMFEFFKLEEAEQERSYQKNVKYCKKLLPQEFGVPDEFCLNEKTINYFIEKGMLDIPLKRKNIPTETIKEDITKEAETSNLSLLVEEDLKNQDSQNPPSSKEIIDQQDNKTEATNQPDHKQELEEVYKSVAREVPPFDEAITMISSLKHRRSPIHKLKATVKVAELISKSIEKFYARFGLINSHKLDADQTLSIFLYIVAKSGISDLTAHCRIIEKFSTNNILNSVSGYYATTLEACVNCICSMNFTDQSSVSNRLSSGFREFVTSIKRNSVERQSVQRDRNSTESVKYQS